MIEQRRGAALNLPPPPPSGGGPRRPRATTLIWTAVAVLLILACFHPVIRHVAQTAPHRINIAHIRDLIARWGPWAPVAAVLILIAHTFVPFPADLLYLANGALFGFWGGLLVSWVGTMASACLAFGIARALGRPTTVRIVPRAMLDWADTWVAREGWTMALAVRFVPLFPFSLLNFALGLTPVSWATFLWTTGVGILPANIALVAAGYGATGTRKMLRWALLALLALAVIGMVIRYRFIRPSMVEAERARFLKQTDRTTR